MKKKYILLTFLLISFLSSCFRTSFTFPDRYEGSNWVANSNDIVISLEVISYEEVYATINFNEYSEIYEVSFRVDNASFRCLDENKNYILIDGTTISRNLYNETFPSSYANVKLSTFFVTKTKDKYMKCYITYDNLYYIFPYLECRNLEEKIIFEFYMVE